MSRSSLQKRTPLIHDEEQPEEPLAQIPLPSRQLPGAAIQVETEQLGGTDGLQKKGRYDTVSYDRHRDATVWTRRLTLARAIEFPPGFLSGRDMRSMSVSWIVCNLGWRNLRKGPEGKKVRNVV